MRKPVLAVFALIAMLGLAVPQRPADARTLRYASASPILTMDPHATADFITQIVATQVYEALVKLDADMSLKPGLAVSWEPTGERTWRFKLRPGVRFHDGTPLRPTDIWFSINRAREGRFWAVFAAPVERVDVVDDTTIDIVTRTPEPLLPRKLSNISIMSEEWARQHDALRAHDLAATGGDFYAQRNANGTGLMTLGDYRADRVTLRRNPAWWGQAETNLDEAVYVQIGAAATRVAALLSGEVDLVADLPLQDIERVRATPGFRVEQVPQMLVMQLNMDGTAEGRNMWDRQGILLPHNPLQDVRVRRAIAMAIDENAIVTRIMRGSAVAVGTAAVPGVNGYQRDLDVRLPYDVAGARRVLTEAGYPDGFKIQLDCPTDRYVNTEAICRAVTTMLSQVNIEVVLNLQPWSAFVPPLTRLESSFHLIGERPIGGDTQDTLQTTMMTRGPVNGYLNWARWSNAEFDATVTQLLTEFDPARRQALYHRALEIGRDNVQAAYLHTQMVTWGLRANIQARMRADASVPLEYVRME
jgi:peptide/nickel transport system substrate-binding protein